MHYLFIFNILILSLVYALKQQLRHTVSRRIVAQTWNKLAIQYGLECDKCIHHLYSICNYSVEAGVLSHMVIVSHGLKVVLLNKAECLLL